MISLQLLQRSWKAVLAVLAIVLVGLGVMRYVEMKRAYESARQRSEVLQVINDSTEARVALLKRENGTLRALVDASKTMDGKLVAGVRIVVKSDTVRVPTAPVTTELHGYERRAQVTDTLKGGYQVTVTAVAPPHPGALQLGYNLVTPEFRPEVGFVQTKDGSVHAVVSWADQKFEIQDAFFVQKNRRLSVEAGVEQVLTQQDATVAGYVAAQYQLKDRLGVYTTVGHSLEAPYVAVGASWRLW